MAKRVGRWSSQERRLWTWRRSKRDTPHNRRDSSICERPRVAEEIQTLSAEKTFGFASLFRAYPMVACEEPYIGEESISTPPLSRNALTTAVHRSSAARSSPTLKVIQLPI